jgi:hypothetical protein
MGRIIFGIVDRRKWIFLRPVLGDIHNYFWNKDLRESGGLLRTSRTAMSSDDINLGDWLILTAGDGDGVASL